MEFVRKHRKSRGEINKTNGILVNCATHASVTAQCSYVIFSNDELYNGRTWFSVDANLSTYYGGMNL